VDSFAAAIKKTFENPAATGAAADFGNMARLGGIP